jgi:hypothetical protein
MSVDNFSTIYGLPFCGEKINIMSLVAFVKILMGLIQKILPKTL